MERTFKRENHPSLLDCLVFLAGTLLGEVGRWLALIVLNRDLCATCKGKVPGSQVQTLSNYIMELKI